MTVKSEYFLKTERLGFRCWREDDLPLATGLWSDPEVTALLGGPIDPQARLNLEITRKSQNGIQYWPVFLLEDGRHVGCAGLQLFRQEAQTWTYELGYHLRREFWGQGLAKEAGRAVIDYAFAVLKFESLFAGHHPSNATSRKVLLSLGFVYSGEELYPPSGMIEPTYRLRNPHFEAK